MSIVNNTEFTLEQAIDNLIERDAQLKLLKPSTWFGKQQPKSTGYGDPAWHKTKQQLPNPESFEADPMDFEVTETAPEQGPAQQAPSSQAPDDPNDPIPNVFVTDQAGNFADQSPEDFEKALANYVGAIGKKAPTTYQGNPDSGIPSELSMPNTKALYNAIISKFYQNQRDHMEYFADLYKKAKYKHQRDKIRMQALEWMAKQRSNMEKLKLIHGFWTKTQPKLYQNKMQNGGQPPSQPISVDQAVEQNAPPESVELKPINVPTPDEHAEWERQRRQESDRKHRQKVKDQGQHSVAPEPHPAAPPPEFQQPKQPAPTPAPPAQPVPAPAPQPAKPVKAPTKRKTKQEKLDEINNELTALQTQWGPYQNGNKAPGTYEEKQELLRGIERMRELERARNELNTPRKRAPKTTAPAPQPPVNVPVTPETTPVQNVSEKPPRRTRKSRTPKSGVAVAEEFLEKRASISVPWYRRG